MRWLLSISPRGLPRGATRISPRSIQARRLPSGETATWLMDRARRWLEAAWLEGVCSGLGEPDAGAEVCAQTGRREAAQRRRARGAQRRLRGERDIGKMLTAETQGPGAQGLRERVSESAGLARREFACYPTRSPKNRANGWGTETFLVCGCPPTVFMPASSFSLERGGRWFGSEAAAPKMPQ